MLKGLLISNHINLNTNATVYQILMLNLKVLWLKQSSVEHGTLKLWPKLFSVEPQTLKLCDCNYVFGTSKFCDRNYLLLSVKSKSFWLKLYAWKPNVLWLKIFCWICNFKISNSNDLLLYLKHESYVIETIFLEA